MTLSHVEPPSIPLIKGAYDGKSEKDLLKLKLRRRPTSSMSDLYGFRMSLFDNGEPEEFLLFICNFNTTLSATGTLYMGAKIKYIRTLVCGEALRRFYLLFADVENTETLNVDYYIKGIALYFPL